MVDLLLGTCISPLLWYAEKLVAKDENVSVLDQFFIFQC